VYKRQAQDCKNACSIVAKRVKKIERAEIRDVLINGPEKGIVFSREILPELLLTEDFVQRDFFGLFVYMTKDPSGLIMDLAGSQSAFFDYASSGSVRLFANATFNKELEEIAQLFNSECEKAMTDNAFLVDEIRPSDFFENRGVLFGLGSDVKNFGVVVYDDARVMPIWGYCRNDDSGICEKMMKFVSVKK
jgi:hypothetical protein